MLEQADDCQSRLLTEGDIRGISDGYEGDSEGGRSCHGCGKRWASLATKMVIHLRDRESNN